MSSNSYNRARNASTRGVVWARSVRPINKIDLLVHRVASPATRIVASSVHNSSHGEIIHEDSLRQSWIMNWLNEPTINRTCASTIFLQISQLNFETSIVPLQFDKIVFIGRNLSSWNVFIVMHCALDTSWVWACTKQWAWIRLIPKILFGAITTTTTEGILIGSTHSDAQ